jgi:hypothetical protein
VHPAIRLWFVVVVSFVCASFVWLSCCGAYLPGPSDDTAEMSSLATGANSPSSSLAHDTVEWAPAPAPPGALTKYPLGSPHVGRSPTRSRSLGAKQIVVGAPVRMLAHQRRPHKGPPND